MIDIKDFLREDYGSGQMYRQIVLRVTGNNRITAALEDEAHAFILHMSHDNDVITDIEPQWIRHPTSTCPNAGEELKRIVGYSLSANPLGLRDANDARENCTHFFDALSLMCTYATEAIENPNLKPHHFIAKVTDEKDTQQKATLTLNGETVLEWHINNGSIAKPALFSGRKVLKGLIGWAESSVDAKTLEYTLILQKAYFVSQARRLRMNDLNGIETTKTGQPIGACYATRSGRENESVRLATRQEYSEAPEKMLQFIELN